MFKILVLQALYCLSDDHAEFLIQDRLSFMRFLGLTLSDKVPDAKTIWLFREQLAEAGAVEKLFARFDKHLERSGYRRERVSLAAARCKRSTSWTRTPDGNTPRRVWRGAGCSSTRSNHAAL
jgi:IS5 family transposase